MAPLFRSEVDDINLGLEHFYGDFNAVHAQLIASGVSIHFHIGPRTTYFSDTQIKDYAGLIDQISRVLRPGGLIVILEWDFHAYDVNHKRIDLGTHQLGPPWWPRWLAFAEIAVRNSGGSVEAAENLRSWVSNHPAFEAAAYQDYWIPASHWTVGNESQIRIGATMRDDILVGLNLELRPLPTNSALTLGIFGIGPTPTSRKWCS